MKNFESAKVQFVTFDPETEEKYTVNLSNLVADADDQKILGIGQALESVLDTVLDHASIVETHRVSVGL